MKEGIRLDKGQIEMVDDVMAEVLRSKTAAQRIQIGFGLWKSAHDMLLSHLGSSNPEWDEAKLNREVAKRLSHGVV
jgi:hypothetical protein